jgi:hypothetical protein
VIKKTAQSNQLPNRRKFAQSGHPVGKPEMKIKKLLSQNLKPERALPKK